jgi:hypothetical protein
MYMFSGTGAGDRQIHQQENGTANGIPDFFSSRQQSIRSRAGSSKEHTKTPLIEVKIFSSYIGSFKYFYSLFNPHCQMCDIVHVKLSLQAI